MKVKVAILGSPPFCRHKATLNLNHKPGHDPPCVCTHAERSHTTNEVHVRVWWITNNPPCAESVDLQSVVVEHYRMLACTYTYKHMHYTNRTPEKIILHSRLFPQQDGSVTPLPTVRLYSGDRLGHTAAHRKTIQWRQAPFTHKSCFHSQQRL